MSEQILEHEQSLFAALADPMRRNLLVNLAEHSPRTATQLAQEYPITRQGILKHLTILEEAGLVAVHQAGREKRYALRPEPLEELEQWIATWQPPVAVLTAQDILCRYTANACLNAGLRIPEDVALIGMGNEPIMCLHPEPSLSSFDLNYEHVGYEAAALLDQLMNGKPAPTEPNSSNSPIR